MIENLFDKIVSTKRLAAVAGTDNEAPVAFLTDVNCNIQPLDDNFSEDLNGSYGKDFLMFCGDVDIKQGDTIVDGATEYLVMGVEDYDFIGQAHREIRIRRCQ